MAERSPSPAPADADSSTRCVSRHPFNDDAADVVFTTADGVDFRVHRSILSIASPFFADMFSLAQPEKREGVHAETISIAESSETFDSLLRLCYPIPDPVIEDLAQLQLLLDAATKYQLEEALNLARRIIRQFVDVQPLQAFALACRFGAEDESRLAASAWKRSYESKFHTPTKKPAKPSKPVRSRVPPPAYHDFATTLMSAGYIPEMADIPAAIYHRLMYYGRIRFDTPPTFIHRDSVYPLPVRSPAAPLDDVAQWHIDVADADVIVRSVDGVDFPFHKLLLRLSAVTKLLDAGSTMDSTDGKPPTIQVGISSQVLRDLLNVCLPSTGCEIEDTYRLWKLSRVAIEYDMTPVIVAVKKQIQRKASSWPLSVYLIASQNGWRDEAASSARLLTEQVHVEDIYDPILEDVPASTFYALLRYHHYALAAMAKVMQKYTPARQEWKGLYTRYPDTWPSYVALPIAGQELERQMQKSTPSRNQRPYAITTLISESEKMEKEVKNAVSSVKLELPEDTRQSRALTVSSASPSRSWSHQTRSLSQSPQPHS